MGKQLLGLEWEDRDALYEISCLDGTTCRVRVRESAWNVLGRLLTDEAPIVLGWRSSCPWIPVFQPPGITLFGKAEAWGFGPLLEPEPVSNGWIGWRFSLPDGKISVSVASSERGTALVATLNVLFSLLSLHEQTGSEARSDSFQLFTVDLGRVSYAGGWRVGYPISATLAPVVLKWIAKQPRTRLTEIESALKRVMIKVYFFMMGRTEDPLAHSFVASFQETSVHFQVPGDACTLAGRRHLGERKEGLCLEEHNLDGPPQQFAFLMALASLADVIRTDLAGSQPTP